jgi:thioredoxin 1
VRIRKTLQLALVAGALHGCGGGSPMGPSPEVPSGPSAIVTLTSANFEAEISQQDRVAMVEFYSPGCTYCRSMEPIVESLARDFSDRALVAKVDVTTERTLADDYRITGYPTFVFFKSGAEVRRLLGAQNYEVLADALRRLLDGS